MSHAEMWPEPVQRVSSVLRAAAVDAHIHEFAEGTPTAEAAAQAIGCDVGQIVKSLVFVCDGAYALALVPGDRRADESKVAAALGASSARIARAGEVLRATGFEPGAVAPFPQLLGVQAVLERTLLQHKVVWIGAGSTYHMAALSPSDLQRLARARSVDLVAPG
jgi:prolyl-tRNA editing enzyme YbaK/EbsC (Cys-tRNA(Pro) deacylase)